MILLTGKILETFPLHQKGLEAKLLVIITSISWDIDFDE